MEYVKIILLKVRLEALRCGVLIQVAQLAKQLMLKLRNCVPIAKTDYARK